MGAAFGLIAPDNRSKLPSMVGTVIYIRVSTKEQTENLSLPTELRACGCPTGKVTAICSPLS